MLKPVKQAGKVNLHKNMPEEPSIILLKEAVATFTGEKIIAVSGNSKIDQSLL